MRKKSKIFMVIIGIFLIFILWWSYFAFCLPHYHIDNNRNLISGNTKLVLVPNQFPQDKTGIVIPQSFPFWKSIGVVDGGEGGRLWKFTDKGKVYVLYNPDIEMGPSYIYQYEMESLIS